MTDHVISVYEEAASCLNIVAFECEKESGVDLNLMVETCKRCSELTEQLRFIDGNADRQPALSRLSKMIDYFKETLGNKVQQIEQDSQSSGEHSSRSVDMKDSSDQGRKMAIEDTILQKGSLKFEDVAGLTEAKQALKEAIIMPLQFPQLFTGARKPWRRILLYGPPGTGKSRLAQAISTEIKSSFYCVSSSDLISSWVGESEKLIKELFAHATGQSGRSVIFIDEIDSICRKRSSREEEHTRRIKTELLKQMEGADNSNKLDKIFLLCATNCPWELDSAFLRRFQKRIYIPLPNRDSRVALIKIHCKDNPVCLSEEDWNLLADKTEGYSGSDIANAVLEAMFLPIRFMQHAEYWKYVRDGKLVPCDSKDPGAFGASLCEVPPDKVMPREVTLADFLSSLTTHRHTVTTEELLKFQNFTDNFGQNG